jgi:hypothetical protein
MRLSAAHSSRIKKSKPAPFKRKTSTPSPYADLPRRKPIARSQSKPESPFEDDHFNDRLDDVGLVKALATDLSLRDVPQAIKYIRNKMFNPVPLQGAGISSTRTAELLNFRKALPPIVSISHVHALLDSPTTVEREIAEMVKSGTVRKIIVPGRGGVGEALILMQDLESMIRSSDFLDQDTKDRFIKLLASNPSALHISASQLSAVDAKALMHAGFLTASHTTVTNTDVYSRPGDGSYGTLTSLHSISKAASGSLAAVGGEGAVHAAGGSGNHARVSSITGNLTFAIPTTGPYIKLLTAARAHLVSLLSRSKFRETTQDLLRERWDGGIAGDDRATEAKRNRGEWTGVLPGRTKKWKVFWGLDFEWVLEECVGAGLVEVFNTRSVGRAVRAL